jgi:hypothetical protein
MSDTGELAKALAAFQAEMPTVSKDRKARVPTKAGGSYEYTYAGLREVTDAAMPILSAHGLSFSCCPRRSQQGDYDLIGILLHASGERLEGCLPIQGTRAQEIGSAITYGRRYLLGSMTGIVTDDDDDGTIADQAEDRRAQRVNTVQEDAWTTQPGDPKMQLPMSEKSRARMFALFAKHKITDEEEQRRGISQIIHREVASRGELTEGEVQSVIAVLAARPVPAAPPEPEAAS